MRICFLATTQSVHTRRWVSWFAEQGHDVHVITFESSLPSWLKPQNLQSDLSWRHEGLTIHHLKTLPSIPHSPLISWPIDNIRIKSLLKKINPDVIHGHVAFPYGFYAASSGFHPCVVTVWGSDVLIAPGKSKIAKWEVQYTLKRVDLLTSDGVNIKKPLAQLGADLSIFHSIYFGVDINKFNSEQRNEELKTKLEIDNSLIIISTRNLEPIYDVESLISAIPNVLREIPQAKVILLGTGSQETHLKALAKSLGVSNAVKFIGRIPHDNLPLYLNLADLYVSTALSDTISVSLLEAMACQLPAIITSTGDNSRWIQNGVNGYIIPIKNPESLSEKIVYLLKNTEIREKMGELNLIIVKEKANYDTEMKKMESLYDELIKQKKGAI